MIKLSFGKAIAAILLAIVAFASTATAQVVRVPIITSITPVSAAPGGEAFTLTVNGANFIASNSHLLWNGNKVTATFVSTDKLTAAIPATLIATAQTATVAVYNLGSKLTAAADRSGAIPAGGLNPYIAVSNVVSFPVGPPITTLTVAAATATVGNFPIRIATGDFNQDSDLDMVVSNFSDSTVSILLGKGDGTFQTQTTLATLGNPAGIAVGDLNNDGYLDLVIGGYGTGLNVALGMESAGFTVTAISGASSPANPVLADVNADGFLDIVVGNLGTPGVLVYLGTGTGTFQATPTTLASTGQVWSVAVGDFNGDGNLDIAAANFTTGNIDVYLGDGTGNFAAAVSYPAVAGAWSIATGDFNGDGILDLAVSSNSDSPGNGIVVLLGKNDGTFEAPSSVVASGVYLGLTSGDLSSDGKMDLVGVQGGNGASVGFVQAWFGNGDGTFQAPQLVSNLGGQDGVALGSFANGAGLDVVSTGFQSVNISQPTASLSPATFDFGTVAVDSSASQNFTLTNSTAAALHLEVSVSGTNFAEYSVLPGVVACPSGSSETLAAGTSCGYIITFAPTTTTPAVITFGVNDAAPGSPQTAAIMGNTVIAPAVTLSVATLAFGNENITVTTASMPVTITNTGGADLTGLTLGLTGTNASDFNYSGNCPVSGILAASASCTVNVTFTPAALGARTASLQFTDNASDSPQSVALTGMGVQVAEQLLYIDGPPPTLIAGGNIGTITVGVYTMQSMLITSANEEIQVTINGPNSFHQNLSTAAVSGVATFNFSAVPLDAAGSYTITAAIDDVVRSKSRRAIRANSVSIAPAFATTVVSAQSSPTQMNVSGYPSPTFTGFAHTFTVSITDMFLNPIATYTGTVTLSSSDVDAVLTPSPYTFVSGDMGAHTFTGTLNKIGRAHV